MKKLQRISCSDQCTSQEFDIYNVDDMKLLIVCRKCGTIYIAIEKMVA